MLEAVSLFIIIIITHIVDCYSFSKMVNKKYNINYTFFIILFLLSMCDYYLGITYGSIFKIILTNVITIILLKIMSKESMSKLFIGIIFIYMGYVISEAILFFICLYVLNIDIATFTEKSVENLLGNIIILIMYINLFRVNKITIITKKTINWCGERNKLNLVLNVLFIMILLYTILYPIAYNTNFINFDFLILCIFLGIIVFVIGYFNEKSNNNQLTVKYDNLLDYVKDYELEVVEKGKAIHEHKNQLAVIDDMIPKSNKKLKEYVSEKLDKVSKLDDNVWLEKLTNLPTGGTKGLVYLKIKKMLDNNISIYVEIDDDLKTKNKWNNVSKYLEDYTRILGVYLDNAIEASIESKDKQIIIEFIDNEDNIEFILSNTYKGRINVEEIDKEKYSTKGKGRGYGLSLVKDIVEKNKLISQSREINGRFYVQKLCIKK